MKEIYGIRLYKLLFEALYRIKLKYLGRAVITQEKENLQSLQILIQNAQINNYCDNIQMLIVHPDMKFFMSIMKGDMAVWLDSFSISFIYC